MSAAVQTPLLSVEKATELHDDDLSALCESANAAILDGGGFGWISPPGQAALERYFRGVMLVPERELFIARADGVITGSAQLVRQPRNNEAQAFAANLMHAFVAPFARGNGLARLLTLRIEERARNLGYKVLNLDVRETQEARHRPLRIARLHTLGHASGICARKRDNTERLLLHQDPKEDWGRCAIPPKPPVMILTLYPAIDLKDGVCVRLKRGTWMRRRSTSRTPLSRPRHSRSGQHMAARGRSQRRLRRPPRQPGRRLRHIERRHRAGAARRRHTRHGGDRSLGSPPASAASFWAVPR